MEIEIRMKKKRKEIHGNRSKNEKKYGKKSMEIEGRITNI